jgi:hypothetical protein
MRTIFVQFVPSIYARLSRVNFHKMVGPLSIKRKLLIGSALFTESKIRGESGQVSGKTSIFLQNSFPRRSERSSGTPEHRTGDAGHLVFSAIDRTAEPVTKFLR